LFFVFIAKYVSISVLLRDLKKSFSIIVNRPNTTANSKF